MVLRKERISSRFSLEMDVQRRCRPSTMSSHSTRAMEGDGESRWLKRVLMAVVSGREGSSGMRRTSRPEGGQLRHVIIYSKEMLLETTW
jgi:hypothetical protein